MSFCQRDSPVVAPSQLPGTGGVVGYPRSLMFSDDVRSVFDQKKGSRMVWQEFKAHTLAEELSEVLLEDSSAAQEEVRRLDIYICDIYMELDSA